MRLLIESKSDNLIFMKRTMTATEVARNFSAVLDAVQAGEEIEITRGKKVVAVLKPEVPEKTGARLKAAFRERHERFGTMDDETYAIYQEILAERHAPENLVGGELDRKLWQE